MYVWKEVGACPAEWQQISASPAHQILIFPSFVVSGGRQRQRIYSVHFSTLSLGFFLLASPWIEAIIWISGISIARHLDVIDGEGSGLAQALWLRSSANTARCDNSAAPGSSSEEEAGHDGEVSGAGGGPGGRCPAHGPSLRLLCGTVDGARWPQVRNVYLSAWRLQRIVLT